jgi:Ni/Fe-hydrogenase 1 B-type cytochrome subunit
MSETHGISRQMSAEYEFAPGRTRVYVWERPVRLAHWLLFLSLIVLSITGYYIFNPFIISRGSTMFVMGTMRFIHLVAAWFFIAAVALRIYWYFRGNQWARIDQFIPTTRERWKDFVETGEYYSFQRWNPTAHLGHNAMAGAAYFVIFVMALVEILTGLALYNNILHSKVLGFVVNWVSRVIDIQYLREIHFIIMFLFWMFFIHHMYSAMLTASEEKNGCLESIFTGYKFGTQKDLEREFGIEQPVERVQAPAAPKTPHDSKASS